MIKEKGFLTIMLFWSFCSNTAANSRLIALAKTTAKQHQHLYRSGRAGAKLGKIWGSQPVYGYPHIRPLSTSTAPNLLHRVQNSFAHMAGNLYGKFSSFLPKQIAPQSITLSSIRSEMHAAHERDDAGNLLLPKNVQVKIKELLSESSHAEAFLAELATEITSVTEQLIDLETLEPWYQERGAQKLWLVKLKELGDELYSLQLIERFAQPR